MEPMPRVLKILNGLSAALFVVALYLVFLYAPREAVMGDVQRVFYFHVSAGWVGALAFLVTAIAGGIYLGTRQNRWDRVATASVEIGMVFAFINIVSGSIWARPVWNTWWTWDPRLVTATIMELIYLAYLMLRQGIEDPDRRARFGSVYGIVAFISVPITFLSIRFFRTIHPVVIGPSVQNPDAEGGFAFSERIGMVLGINSAIWSILVPATLIWHRVRLQQLAEAVNKRKAKLLNQ